MSILAIGCLIGFVLLSIYSMCVVAGEADEQMELELVRLRQDREREQRERDR